MAAAAAQCGVASLGNACLGHVAQKRHAEVSGEDGRKGEESVQGVPGLHMEAAQERLEDILLWGDDWSVIGRCGRGREGATERRRPESYERGAGGASAGQGGARRACGGRRSLFERSRAPGCG